MRYSKQREAVYQTLCNTTTHPDVQWIYTEVRKVMPHVSLGTVYRNLDELCLLGKIHRIGVEAGAERFDARMDTHAHLVCDVCGSVTDVEVDDYSVECSKQGVSRCEVMMYGICDKCCEENK